MTDKKKLRQRRVEGSIVRIPLGEKEVSYGLVLREPLIAFYDKISADEEMQIDQIFDLPIAFVLMVMNYSITDGGWVIMGRVEIPSHLQTPPAFCKQDELTGELSIYQELPELAPTYERPATYEECLGLETAAVWEPEHVEDRLKDHFSGRSNIWVENLRIRPRLH